MNMMTDYARGRGMNIPIHIEAQAIRNQIERLKILWPELAEDTDLLAGTLEGETELHELVTRLVRMSRDAQAFAAAIKDEEADLRERRERFERRADSARSIMQSLLETSGLRKIELPVATVSIVRGRMTCFITNQDALPKEYLKVETTPKKAAITKALLAGEDVPGAALSNGPETLMVRV